MRAPLRANPSRRQVALPFTIPAPTGGWDAKSPLANMKPDRAVILENLFPKPGYLELRRGYAVHGTGVGAGAVETVMPWHGPSSSKLFAAGGTAIYDATTAGAASSAVTGLSNARFQWTMFRTSGGNFLWVCNGEDSPRHYDGTSWDTPSITGITGTDVVNVSAHKSRLWLTLKNSTKAAYLATNAVAGAATEFDFGALFTDGGYLVGTATWTLDGGSGVDDYFAAISSRGQIAVYQGTDPAAADTWALVGVYKVGAPIGRRCFTKVGGDLAIITVDGVLPLSLALPTDRAASERIAITANISDAMNAAARLYSGNFGWQLIGYPKGTMAILNVPTTEGAGSHQYVMNTLTGAWCKFTGINAICWTLLGDDLYFGGTGGKVFKADTGTDDNSASIVYDVLTAWRYPGGRGQIVQVGMLATLLGTDGTVNPAIEVLTNFNERLPVSTSSFTQSTGTAWDESDWDVPDWASVDEVIRNWAAVAATGSAIAIRMRGSAKGVRLNVYSWDGIASPGALV